MTHHILYIPGFGTNTWKYQQRFIKKWQKFGVETHFIPINWDDDEPYATKLHMVTDQIDKFNTKDNKVSLVGVSAAGSLALNSYVARKDAISGVVFICGKLRNPEGVREFWFKKHPAFRQSIFDSAKNIEQLGESDKVKMQTIRPIFDGLIPAHDSQIPGVKNRILPIKIHVPSIFLALTLFKKVTINFLKSRAEVK